MHMQLSFSGRSVNDRGGLTFSITPPNQASLQRAVVQLLPITKTRSMNGMLQTFTTMVLVLQADCFGTHPVSPPSDETFDYIIVGSGPGGAGALLGLIEHDPSANILLLERGKNLLSPSPSGGVLAATTGATADFVASEGATTFKDIDNVIIVESNTLGGLAAINAGVWHHMPADYVASKPPNGDAHFDAAAWARAAASA